VTNRKPRKLSFWTSENGDAAVTYIVVVSVALPIAFALVTLQSPVRLAADLATAVLAENI